MDDLSPTFQVNLRNFCGDLVLRHIGDMFDGAGIACGPVPTILKHGQRRTLVQQYWENIDWNSPADVQKVLRAVTITLFSASVPTEQQDALRKLCAEEGLRIDGKKVVLGAAQGAGIKNLIFAAIGYMPEIVMVDATTNEIKITKNEQYCLVYDRPILSEGLLWSDLVSWWLASEKGKAKTAEEADKELYDRLEQSLDGNRPEMMLMRRYFMLKQRLGSRFPAMIPQVYLHYDPYTVRERGGAGPLERQRMDFLLLLNGGRRIVLEIDGKQHYSEGDRSSPTLYAKMVSEDRRIKLRGYEVYRFGGQEFVNASNAQAMLDEFFVTLFDRCGYRLD